jgi:hypothetical protein
MIEHIEKTNQQVWKLKGVTYVPHYSKPDTFVGPGWSHWVATKEGGTTYYPPEYTLLELIGKGAVAAEMFLWAR